MDDPMKDEELRAFNALLMTYELCARKLGKTPECLETMQKLDDTAGAIRYIVGDYSASLTQVHDSYQDIAKTYFEFVAEVEKALAISGPQEIDHQFILGAIQALKEVAGKVSAPRQDGPGIQGYAPVVTDDPSFIIAMKPSQKGKWVHRDEHQFAVARLREGSEVALAAREAEILALKAELKALRTPLPTQESPDAQSDPDSALKA